MNNAGIQLQTYKPKPRSGRLKILSWIYPTNKKRRAPHTGGAAASSLPGRAAGLLRGAFHLLVEALLVVEALL